MPEASNSFSPPNDLSEPAHTFEKSTRFQNLLQEIKQLNKTELFFLLMAIDNLQNFKNYSSSLF
jgi:hypothetical protein